MDPGGGPASGGFTSKVHHRQVTVSKVVFRTPPTAHLAALLLAVTATPFAFAAPGLFAIYLVPIVMIVWVWRNRTVAEASGLTARTLLYRKVLPWDQLASLKLDRGRVSAVSTDGTETRLPGVRLRHLSLISSVSNGVVPDPSADENPTENPTENSPAEDSPAESSTAKGSPDEAAAE